MKTFNLTCHIFVTLKHFEILDVCDVFSLTAHRSFLVVCNVELLNEMELEMESSLESSSAVPMTDEGRPPTLT